MQRTFSVLGDSYSTFEGWNPAGQDIFYPGPAVDDVLKVEDTWWHRLAKEQDLRLLMNDSWSGSTVCRDVREPQPPGSSFLVRMKKTLSGEGTEKPDIILLFGGTNDDWLERKTGRNIWENRTEDDLWQILPAFCEMLEYVSTANPQAQVICIVNTDFRSEVTEGIMKAAEHYSVTCCRLHGIDKQNGHPTRTGMAQIAEQVAAVLK